MAKIIVTTAKDVVDANDGVISLREALATAAKATTHTDISFKASVFFDTKYFKTALEIKDTLIIAKGADVTIDGSTVFGGQYNNLTLQGTNNSHNMLTVEKGATALLRDLNISGSAGGTKQIAGAYGSDGAEGKAGLDGKGDGPHETITAGSGEDGTDATDGFNAPNTAGTGGMAVGGIINKGVLTTERVALSSLGAHGGAGGFGGDGGRGGAGGIGFNSRQDQIEPGGDGGNGGDSGNGGRGGAGGAAVAGIYNSGTMVVRDTTFGALWASGGNGGQGGDGANGGIGGTFGHGQGSVIAHGGNGGDGGNGGNGGSGGVTVGAIWNTGTISFGAVQSGTSARLDVGLGGQGGYLGEKGVGGRLTASSGTIPGHDGLDGAAGIRGTSAGAGASSVFLGTAPRLGNSFIIDSSHTVYSDNASAAIDRVAYINVALLGGVTASTKVDWTFKAGAGITAADFVSGKLPTHGTVDLTQTGNKTLDYMLFYLKDDDKAEGIETFTVTLSNPKGGELGWSKSIKIIVTDGTINGHAPTSVALSAKTVVEDASNGKLVGTLSTTDTDKGDQFVYKLLDDAGGRFKLDGAKVVVANGPLLDFEQAQSHKITVQSTDLFGLSVSKTLTIKVTDDTVENVKGDSGKTKLVGGANADKLDGGAGNDTLTGAGGNDTFVFSTKLDAKTNVDHITDFSSGHDVIQLDDAIFKALAVGNLAKGAFYAHDAVKAHDGTDRILFDTATGKLYYDVDGNEDGGKAAVLFAVIDHDLALKYTDIHIV